MTEENTQSEAGLASDLNRELDTIDEVMTHRLAAISVAAMQDTEESRKDRITQDNMYWSPAYADMCRKVDQLIALRAVLKQEADYCYHWMNESLLKGDADRAMRHKERGDRLMASI